MASLDTSLVSLASSSPAVAFDCEIKTPSPRHFEHANNIRLPPRGEQLLLVLLLFDAFAPISFLLVLLLLLLFVVVVCFAATGSFVENERLIFLLLSGLVKAVKEVKVREKELQESFCSRSIALKLLRCRDKQAVEEETHALCACVGYEESDFP